jgi:hypothetical protein
VKIGLRPAWSWTRHIIGCSILDLDALLTAIDDLSMFFEGVLDKLEEAESKMDQMIK